MKRSREELAGMVKDVNIIMLDIEGTTTSISFVKEELFPYVRRELKTFLEETWDSEETQKDVDALRRQIDEDVSAGQAGSQRLPAGGEREDLVPVLVKNVMAMMDADRKVSPLKTLQGHMWRHAYHKGIISGHVYEDVPGALKSWKSQGKTLVVYSSGSVEAQKLLFGHSCFGDMLHLFSDHFDTSVGPKVETESYKKIVQQLRCAPEKVLFLTDLAKEAWAAKRAGLPVVLSIREGTAPLTPEDEAAFPAITSFTQLLDDDENSTSSSTKQATGEQEKEEEKNKAKKRFRKENRDDGQGREN